MYCSECGTQIPDGAAFCQGCGTRVNVSIDSEAAEAGPAVVPPAAQPTGANRARPGYCERCGRELGVNEKLRGLTAHEQCPAPVTQAPAAARPVSMTPPASGKRTALGIVVIVGALLAVLGCLLPWADLDIWTGNGFDVGYLTDPKEGMGQDGLFVLLMGLVAAGVGVYYFYGRNALAGLALFALGAAIAAVAGYDVGKMVQAAQEFCDESSGYGFNTGDCNALDIVGEGLYMTIAGGAVTALAGLAGLLSSPFQRTVT